VQPVSQPELPSYRKLFLSIRNLALVLSGGKHVDDDVIPRWERPQRKSETCALRVEHVMASAALPFFFPALEVDGAWYGDGGIRLTAPTLQGVTSQMLRCHASPDELRIFSDNDDPSADLNGEHRDRAAIDALDWEGHRLAVLA
jgi:Patatin-like phospholipase